LPAHSVEVAFEPIRPLLAGRTHIDLEKPRVALLVDEDVVAEEGKAASAAIADEVLGGLYALYYDGLYPRSDILSEVHVSLLQEQLLEGVLVHHRLSRLLEMALVKRVVCEVGFEVVDVRSVEGL
jgi:hypothetical protein